MHKLTRVFVFALLPSLSLAAAAQKPSNTLDAYAAFSEMRANAPVGSCNCFWMSGGTGELTRGFSAISFPPPW